jgi:iron complex transport system substrate-binding protein
MSTCIKIIMFLTLFFITSAGSAYERIIVLYAAVSPIVKELGAADKVIAVTRPDELFPQVPKVGSHLRPNIELIKALKPDLIMAGSPRAFPPALREKINVKVFYYDPHTIEDVVEKIRKMGKILEKEEEAEALIEEMNKKIAYIVMPEKKLTVVYEVTAQPLKMAGRRHIITSVIAKAGGVNLIDIEKKHVLMSPEKIIELTPDIYIYQQGPMNKNPTDPLERPYFAPLTRTKTIKVKEIEFARPGINIFDALVKLNDLFLKESKRNEKRQYK